MRTNRTVILVLMLLLLVVAAGAYFLMRPRNTQTPTGEVTVTEPPYQETIEIVVAAQNIPRGERLSVENLAVVLQPWPKDALPLEYFDSLEQVNQKFARMDIPRGMPITPGMLGQPGGMLSVEGSAAALFESGRVAYTIPMDAQGAVAWAPMPGDRVHVLATIQLINIDPDFQSPLPNKFLSLPATTEEQQLSGDYGRFETLPNGQDALVYQSGSAIPNLVVQMTVQNAIVWRIGIWDETAAPVTTASAQQDQSTSFLGTTQQTEATPVAPPLMRSDIEPVTLLVYPQDALVLKYLSEMGADLDLVLCSAADSGPVITEPVWLRYVLDKYQISDQPSDLPVAATPVHPPLTLPTVAPTAPAN